MPVPNPTFIYRIIHIDNLGIYLKHKGIHAPNYTPNDGLIYKTIHNEDIQAERCRTKIPCGQLGNIHDYVSFYFGYLSPMLLQLKTNRVEGYSEGQDPLIYLVSSVQNIYNAGANFVFSDGHGIAAYTEWYDNLADLDKVDWNVVYKRYWADTTGDMDRQRRKQAEFLVHRFCDWKTIDEIGVIDTEAKKRVEQILSTFPRGLARPVKVTKQWYY